jgi:hypothetical protein
MAFQQTMYEVLWPRGRNTMGTASSARRLNTLEGKTICELSNRSFHSNETFPFIEKELTRRYPGIKFVSYENFGKIDGADEKKVNAELPDTLKENKCDAVIAGNGC